MAPNCRQWSEWSASAVHKAEGQDPQSTVSDESNNVWMSCSLKLTMYWMLLIPVAHVA